MAELYLIANGAAPTTAAQLDSDTGTAIKTLLQVKLSGSGTLRGKVVEWGISFNASAAATPVACELFANSAAATVTAHVAAGIVNLDPGATTPTDDQPFDISANTTGWMSTGASGGEGTPASVRMMDVQYVAPTNQYIKQWPLGREPMFDRDEYLRVRVTSGSNYGVYTYVIVEV
jgi:hypothetical protein